LLTSVVGIAGAALNHRWQNEIREKEREDRLHESRTALRRDAYTRLLIASERVGDFLVMQPPIDVEQTPISSDAAAKRARELWAGGNEHMAEYAAALAQARLLAGAEVATALEEFDDWMGDQVVIAMMDPDPLRSEAFMGSDKKQVTLIHAMQLEQDGHFVVT
jgi:hypothetical protein